MPKLLPFPILGLLLAAPCVHADSSSTVELQCHVHVTIAGSATAHSQSDADITVRISTADNARGGSLAIFASGDPIASFAMTHFPEMEAIDSATRGLFQNKNLSSALSWGISQKDKDKESAVSINRQTRVLEYTELHGIGNVTYSRLVQGSCGPARSSSALPN